MSAPNLTLLRGPRIGAPVRDILSDLPSELRSLALRLLYREHTKRYVRVDYRFVAEEGYETRQCFVPLPYAAEGEAVDSLPRLPEDIVCGGLFNSIFRYMESPANAANAAPRTLWLDDALGPDDPVVFDQVPIKPWPTDYATRFTRFRWHNFLKSLRAFPKPTHPWESAEDALYPVAQPELHHVVVASLIVSPDAGVELANYGIDLADLALLAENVQARRARRLGLNDARVAGDPVSAPTSAPTSAPQRHAVSVLNTPPH